MGLLISHLDKFHRDVITPKDCGGRPGKAFIVANTGDIQVGLVAFPYDRESTLLSNLAGVYSEGLAYEFNTLNTMSAVIK